MRTPSDPPAQPGACPATDTTPIAATAAAAGAQSEPVSTLTGLAQHLAIAHAQHTQRQTGRHHPRLLDRLPILAMDLRAAYQAVLRMSTDTRALSYPAEWLLDNFYVVEQALHLILEDLPETFYRQLPVLAGEGPASGPPACLYARTRLCGARAVRGGGEPVARLRARLPADPAPDHG